MITNIRFNVDFFKDEDAKVFADSIPGPLDEAFFRGDGDVTLNENSVEVTVFGEVGYSSVDQFFRFALTYIRDNQEKIREALIIDNEPWDCGVFELGTVLGYRYFAGKLRQVYTATGETDYSMEDALEEFSK